MVDSDVHVNKYVTGFCFIKDKEVTKSEDDVDEAGNSLLTQLFNKEVPTAEKKAKKPTRGISLAIELDGRFYKKK